jgi:hypothetical protein
MFNKLGFSSLMGLVGLVTVATSSLAEQTCQQDKPYVIGNVASCTTANGLVSGSATAVTVSGTPRVRANLTKGVDTGVAATRDTSFATGFDNARLIDCTVADRNPSAGSTETSTLVCDVSTILNVLNRDRP